MPTTTLPKAQKREFIEKVKELSGQNVNKCMQCGMCTGACPMTEKMNNYPRRVMRMVHLGLREDLYQCNTPWTCASCYGCSVNCPRGIDIAKVMEALRLLSLRKNNNYIEPSELPHEIFDDCPQIALVSAFRKLTS